MASNQDHQVVTYIASDKFESSKDGAAELVRSIRAYNGPKGGKIQPRTYQSLVERDNAMTHDIEGTQGQIPAGLINHGEGKSWSLLAVERCGDLQKVDSSVTTEFSTKNLILAVY